MQPRKGFFVVNAVAGVAVLTLSPILNAQGSHTARSLISQPIDNSQVVSIDGNVRRAARVAANDRGAVDATLPMEHILLQLQRTPEREAALSTYIEELNDVRSPKYHQWLSADELGEQFGPAEEDITAIRSWLEDQGFTINSVSPTGMLIDFSGTAEQAGNAFRTPIHIVEADGEYHVANMHDPSIPASLAKAVAGVVSLNDFKPRPFHHDIGVVHFDTRTGSQSTEGTATTQSGFVHPDYTIGNGASAYQAVAPGDLAIIYNLKPLFAAGYSGQGQTIAVIEDSNVYSTGDWNSFRSAFGLASYTGGSFAQEHPGNCANPGITADDGEAILDAEWASAAAPSAAIVLASCADTNSTFGGLIALNNITGSPNPPRIISISYGESEAENGSTANLAYSSVYKSAVAEGISIFVSAGDEGPASSDPDANKATHGIAVSGFASTPYNVAVGGTDFGDTYAGDNSTYWNTANAGTYASAKSYIPEIPWNDSCASQLIASKLGYATTYGASGLCNSSTGKASYLTTGAASGGPSGCATGTATTAGVVSGTCKGYSKPSFQTGILGNPADNVRDLPDVSLFAANGVWGHYYIFCFSDPKRGGSPCSGSPSTWSGAGGTSFAAPIMAAIQSLVNQKTKSAWGNPDTTYYNLAKAEYGSSGNSSCNSTNGEAISASCTFHDVRLGSIDVNCTGTHNCYLPSGANGVLSTSGSSYLPAYSATPGWDFATGIGTVNAQNLVENWTSVSH